MSPKTLVCALFCTIVAGVSAAACGDTSLGTSTGSGKNAATTDGGTTDAGSSVKGLGCGVERETGVTLCTGVNACPGLLVDQDAYPGCGFRVTGTGFDLQCACGTDLCPIGTPRTCAQAKTLLTEQNRLSVCAQANEGRCISNGTKPAGSSTSSNNRGCDPQCMSDCAKAGTGNCSFICGC